jgi:hypothetical protein
MSEWIQSWLFENPLPVYLLMGAATLVAGLMYRARRTRPWLTLLVACPLVAAAVGLTAHLVKTDRERIAEAMQALAAGVLAHDRRPVELYIDPACHTPTAGGDAVLDKPRLLALAEQAWQAQVDKIGVGSVETIVAGDNATTVVSTEVGSRRGDAITLKWRLQWARRPAGWRIVQVELLGPMKLADLH